MSLEFRPVKEGRTVAEWVKALKGKSGVYVIREPGFFGEVLYPTQKPLALLERIVQASSNENDIVLDAFCGCGTALVAAQNLKRQWIGIDISPTACRVMAKRLRDVCALPESEPLWKAGRGFVVRDLPWTEEKLRIIPPFEFENWAVIALGGIPNKVQVGDMGVDGRIYPVSSSTAPRRKQEGELAFPRDFFKRRRPTSSGNSQVSCP